MCLQASLRGYVMINVREILQETTIKKSYKVKHDYIDHNRINMLSINEDIRRQGHDKLLLITTTGENECG